MNLPSSVPALRTVTATQLLASSRQRAAKENAPRKLNFYFLLPYALVDFVWGEFLVALVVLLSN